VRELRPLSPHYPHGPNDAEVGSLVKLVRVVCRKPVGQRPAGQAWTDAVLVFNDDGDLVAVHCPIPCRGGCYFFRRITRGPPK